MEENIENKENARQPKNNEFTTGLKRLVYSVFTLLSVIVLKHLNPTPEHFTAYYEQYMSFNSGEQNEISRDNPYDTEVKTWKVALTKESEVLLQKRIPPPGFVLTEALYLETLTGKKLVVIFTKVDLDNHLRERDGLETYISSYFNQPENKYLFSNITLRYKDGTLLKPTPDFSLTLPTQNNPKEPIKLELNLVEVP